MSPVSLREKISTNEGGLSQSPPFCLLIRLIRAHVSRLCGAAHQMMLRIAGRTLHCVRDTRLILSPWKEFCPDELSVEGLTRFSPPSGPL